MSAYQLQNAWQKWNDTRDYDSSDIIIRQYKPLVDYHVSRIHSNLPSNIQKSDIESFGMAGLFDALLKYNPNQETQFDTFASKRIRGAILDGLRKEDRMSRVYRARYKIIRAAFIELEQKYQREVGTDEVAEHLDMTKKEVEEILVAHLNSELLSMDEQIKDDEKERNYIDAIRDTSLTPEEEIVKNDLMIEMAEKIKDLSDREQKIISLFYNDELTITEIGKVLNLTKGRVSQIHTEALAKLKKWLR